MPRFIPRARIFRIPTPEHDGFYTSVLSSEFLTQTAVSPGGRSNLHWMTLRPEDSIQDAGMPGNEPVNSKFRPPAIILNHSIDWERTGVGTDWTYTPSDDEVNWRNYELISLNSELEELQLDEEPDEEKQQRIKDLQGLIEQLNSGGVGYLETGYNMLNTGTSGVVWKLGAPNIPVTLTSTFLSQKGRSLSFRFKRLEAREEQVEHTFTIEFGGGNSLYALEMGADGNACKFIHYKQMSVSARQLLLDAANEILDRGRLTVEDRGNILLRENQIKGIKREQKELGEEAPAEYEASLAQWEQEIKDIKDSKRGINDSDQEALNELEDLLYSSREDFMLNEQASSLIGKAVTITLHFLKSGYIVIQSDEGQKIFEVKRLTGSGSVEDGESGDPRYGDCVPGNTYINLKSTGGMWSLVYGHPKYDLVGTLWSQPFEVPFLIEDEEVVWISELNQDSPGCLIQYELEPVRDLRWIIGMRFHARYRIKVTFRSDYEVEEKDRGKYTPELYYLDVHIPSSPVDDDASYLWHSEYAPYRYDDGSSRIMDLLIQDDEGRSRLCTLTIGDGSGGANLPKLLAGAACDIDLYDTEEEVSVRVMANGFIGTASADKYKRFKLLTGEVYMSPDIGNIQTVEVSGCEGFLDREITRRIVGNYVYLGDYLRLLAQDAGLPSSLYSRLPVADEDDCPRLPRATPGKFPDIKPANGIRYWEWMQYVVRTHAPKWELWTDDSGLNLTLKVGRDKTTIEFSDSVVTDQRLLREAQSPGGLKPTQDIRDRWNKVTCIGALNPKTGMRYSATATIPQAYDTRFTDSVFYTGVEKAYTAGVDESLKSDVECLKAARAILGITDLTPDGIAPWGLTWRVELDLSVRPGDLVKVNGLNFLVKSTDFASLSTKNHDAQKMTVFGLLAEDRSITGA